MKSKTQDAECGDLRAATLCEKCQVISFNDADGDFARIFGDSRRYDSFTGAVDLDYEVQDTLPGLPFLRQSANSG